MEPAVPAGRYGQNFTLIWASNVLNANAEVKPVRRGTLQWYFGEAHVAVDSPWKWGWGGGWRDLTRSGHVKMVLSKPIISRTPQNTCQQELVAAQSQHLTHPRLCLASSQRRTAFIGLFWVGCSLKFRLFYVVGWPLHGDSQTTGTWPHSIREIWKISNQTRSLYENSE